MSLALAGTVHAALVAAGPELLLATAAVPALFEPSACSTGSNGFVVAWAGIGGPFAQRFNASSEAIGPTITVTATRPGEEPDIACASDGSFIVAWRAPGVAPDDYTDVLAQRFDSAGTPLGAAIHVDASEPLGQVQDGWFPAISIAPSGDFVVAWFSDIGSLVATNGIRAQRFDSAGGALGSEIFVDPSPYGTPDVAHAPNGAFVIVNGDTGQRYDAVGVPQGAPFAIPVGDNFSDTRVCHDAAGNFVVAGGNDFMRVQRYDSTGAVVGAMLPGFLAYSVNAHEIVCSGTGEFGVAFVTRDSDGDPTAVRAWYFDATGAMIGDELSVNESRIGFQGIQGYSSPGEIALARDASGHVLAAWVDRRAVGSPDVRLRARMFCDETEAGCVFACPDVSPAIDPDSDGVPSGCDSCTNVGDAQSFSGKASLRVANNPGGTPKLDKVRLKGTFALPGGGIADLAPDLTGARLLIDSAAVGTMLDVALPPGTYAGLGSRGWASNADGTQWRYTDRTSIPLEGITSVLVKSVEGTPPNSVTVVVKSRSTENAPAFYPTVADDIPPHAVIAFGDQQSADAGECGEVYFDVADCTFRDTLYRQIRCKRR